jgi:hypothetical protein
MNPNNQPLTEELEPIETSVTALQNQLNEALKQLSSERLQVVADFVAYYPTPKAKPLHRSFWQFLDF